ncbi:MAG: hypothetical protein R2729_02725 [Bryobacteraceae bacterium]
MNRARRVTVLVWVAAAVVSGFALVPSGAEVGLMRLLDSDYDSARSAYEKRLEAGERSPEVIAALQKIYLEFGDIERATSALEAWVEAHPRSVEARRRLGTIYLETHQTEKQIANGEALIAIEAREEDLRELMRIYDRYSRFDDQKRILEKLAAAGWARDGDYLELGQLQAARGELGVAAETMLAWRAKNRKLFVEGGVLMLGRLLIDSGEAERAEREMTASFGEKPDPELAADCARLLLNHGHAALAWKLLEPLGARFGSESHWLGAAVAAERALGREQAAFDRLAKLGDKLPPELWEPLADLALARKNLESVAFLFEPSRVGRLPGWVLVQYTDAAWAAGRADLVERLARLPGAEAWLRERPLLAVEMALGRGDRNAAADAASLAAKLPLSARDRLALAGLWDKLGDPERSFSTIEAMDPAALDAAAKMHLARTYLARGKAAEGLAKLRPNDGAAWALLALARGETKTALEWLAANPVDGSLLGDLYYTAADGGHVAAQWELARMWQSRPGGSDPERVKAAYGAALTAAAAAGLPVAEEMAEWAKLQLARADLTAKRREEIVQSLIAAKAWQAALPETEKLARAQGGNWLFAFVDAARESGDTARLMRFLEAELGRKDLGAEARAQRMYVLLESTSLDVALPWIRRMAERETGGAGEWTSAYEAALDALGFEDELLAMLRRRALAPETGAEARRAAAWRLLEAGDRPMAEKAFWRLADGAPAESPDVRQLLYLWGPRPSTAALDWLERRATSDPAFVEALLNAGAPARAAKAAASHPEPRPLIYLRALQGARDLTGLGAAIDREVSAQSAAADPDLGRIRDAGKIALEESLWAPAEHAWQQVLRLEGRTAKREPADALAWLARITAGQSRTAPALEYLARWRKATDGGLSLDPSAAELFLLQGQLLEKTGARAEARAAWEAGEKIVEGKTGMDRAARLVAAQLAVRLGRPEGWKQYEELLAASPGDTALRTEMAALRIEQSRLDEAEVLLAPEPGKKAPPETLEIVADWGQPLVVRTETQGRELTIRSRGPLPAGADRHFLKLPPGWVAGVTTGYDTILLTAARDVSWSAKAEGPQRLRIEMTPAVDGPAPAERRRRELLLAQIDLRRGRLTQAARRYEVFSPGESGADPEAILGMALVEQQVGRWRRAEALLRPLVNAPGAASEEARRMREDLWREHRDQVRVDTEHRNIAGLWSLDTARVAGQAVLSPSLRIGYRFEAGRAIVDSYRNTSGATGPFRGQVRRGELSLRTDLTGGTALTGSLFGGGAGAGAGVAWHRPDSHGSFEASAAWRKPFWEFAEGLAQDGTRDRAEILRRQRLGRATAWVAAAINRYGLRGVPAAASTHGVSAGLAVPLGKLGMRGAWTAEYGFDTEHARRIARLAAPSHRPFAPLPFANREIHAAGLSTVQPFGRHWRIEAGAGFTADRLGGNGPYLAGRAVYDAPSGLSFQMYFDRRVSNLYTSSGAATQAGVSVTYRFGGLGR